MFSTFVAICKYAEPIEGLCYKVYADAGYRTRTYRVTGQDVPTTPQRHTSKIARIKTIYDTNMFSFIQLRKDLSLQIIKKIQSKTENQSEDSEMPCVNAGDRNRTYRVTIQDGPTTPRRHICKKAQIKTIYNTNRF